MNLISILWIAAGACALILSGNGMVTRFLPGKRIGSGTTPRLVAFSALMLALGIGCISLAIYEANV